MPWVEKKGKWHYKQPPCPPLPKCIVGVPVDFTPGKRDGLSKYRFPKVLKEGPRKYWLTYNKKMKTGTGPFKNYRAAVMWYERGGR